MHNILNLLAIFNLLGIVSMIFFIFDCVKYGLCILLMFIMHNVLNLHGIVSTIFLSMVFQNIDCAFYNFIRKLHNAQYVIVSMIFLSLIVQNLDCVFYQST